MRLNAIGSLGFGFLAAASACVGVVGCGGADKSSSSVSPSLQEPSGAPVALSPRRATPQTVAMTVNPDEIAKAVERLRMTKRKSESPFEQAGADLSGDGRAKALVLLTGQDWCSPQGCTLVVMEPSDTGFKPVSQIVGVKAPVAAGPGSNAGWRDLIVKTGAGKAVRLQFSGGGYPSNTSAQPDATADVAMAEVLIREPDGAAVASALPVDPAKSR